MLKSRIMQAPRLCCSPLIAVGVGEYVCTLLGVSVRACVCLRACENAHTGV